MGLLEHSTIGGSWAQSPPGAAAASLLAGAAVAAVVSPVLLRIPRGPLETAVLAALDVLAVAAAAWSVARGLRGVDPPLQASYGARVAVTAAWLAPLGLLCGLGSWWTLPVAAAFGAFAASLFRGLAREDPAPETSKGFLLTPEPPVAARRRAAGVKVATGTAYGALAVGMAGDVVLAALLIAAACGIVSWFGAAGTPAHAKAKAGLALALAFFALLPGSWAGFGEEGWSAPEEAKEGGVEAKRPGLHAGVVLLTNLELDSQLVAPPPPHPRAGDPLKPATLFSIPFSGEYWYFFWPLQRPGEDALRKLGDPLTLAYTAVDGSSIVMQARQPLPKPIGLRCCDAIDVILRAQESRPETVYVELLLIDSSQPGEARVTLGYQQLPPPDQPRPTLRFTMPPSPEIRSFDELLVWFHLDESRRQRSANLAIDRFDLIR